MMQKTLLGYPVRVIENKDLHQQENQKPVVFGNWEPIIEHEKMIAFVVFMWWWSDVYLSGEGE